MYGELKFKRASRGGGGLLALTLHTIAIGASPPPAVRGNEFEMIVPADFHIVGAGI